MELGFLWFGFSVVVGIFAARRGRHGFGWFMLAMLISPLLAGLLVAVLGKLKDDDDKTSPSPTTSRQHAENTSNMSISYSLGRSLAQRPKQWLVGVGIFALLAWGASAIGQHNAQQKKIEAEAIAKAEAIKQQEVSLQKTAACNAQLPETKKEMTRLMKQGKLDEALGALAPCVAFVNDPEIDQIADQVRNAIKIRTAKQAAAKAAAEKAKKKSEGVSIGMSQQDVLDSSWGKPQHINRTTTAAGTHEQWVYNLRSYLYFTNGVLTSIQN